jgi:hypothetical protein
MSSVIGWVADEKTFWFILFLAALPVGIGVLGIVTRQFRYRYLPRSTAELS